MKKYRVTLLLSNGDTSSFTTEAQSTEEVYGRVLEKDFFDYEHGRTENRVRVSDISRVTVVEGERLV